MKQPNSIAVECWAYVGFVSRPAKTHVRYPHILAELVGTLSHRATTIYHPELKDT